MAKKTQKRSTSRSQAKQIKDLPPGRRAAGNVKAGLNYLPSFDALHLYSVADESPHTKPARLR